MKQKDATTEALIDVVITLTKIIAMSGGIPSGHLYARLMDKMSLEEYNLLISAVKATGLVREDNYFLTYVGPHADMVN